MLLRKAATSKSPSAAKAIDQLAAFLADLAERPQRMLEFDAELFRKLAPGGSLRLFVGVFSLGNRPGAEVALGPERTAGINEQNPDAVHDLFVHQYAGAFSDSHAASIQRDEVRFDRSAGYRNPPRKCKETQRFQLFQSYGEPCLRVAARSYDGMFGANRSFDACVYREVCKGKLMKRIAVALPILLAAAADASAISRYDIGNKAAPRFRASFNPSAPSSCATARRTIRR